MKKRSANAAASALQPCTRTLRKKNGGLILAALLLCAGPVPAQEARPAEVQAIRVTAHRHVGPLAIPSPVATDSVDLQAKAFDAKSLLKAPLRLDAVATAPTTNDSLVLLAPTDKAAALHLVGFALSNNSFAKAAIEVEGCKNFELYVDGKSQRAGQSLTLLPATHDVVIKALTIGKTDTLRLSVRPEKAGTVSLAAKGTVDRPFTFGDLLLDWHYTSIALSPNGQLAIVSLYNYSPDGKPNYRHEVRQLNSGRVLETRQGLRWMPRTNRYLVTQTGADGRRSLVSIDPLTRDETVLTPDLPEGSWRMLPNERQLVYTLQDNGEQEKNRDVHEVVHPDDRQPGWRSRSRLALYDLATGLMRPLTSGFHSIGLQDVSADSRYLLFAKYSDDITRMRPTTLTSLFRLDLETMGVDTLVWQDGFLEGAHFSPNGRQVLLEGSPEALGGIGNVVPDGRVPSMIDKQLYLMSLDQPQRSADGMVRFATRPLTRDFNPSVARAVWSTADGMIYLTAEDRDYIHLFRLDPKSSKFTLVDSREDVVSRFALASNAPVMIYSGQSATNADRLYTLQTRQLKATLAEAPNDEQHSHLQLSQCQAWTFVNAQGDSVCCRYYLPPSFDPSKKYPMLTYYYGGCSPTSRYFDSRYSPQVFAAQGYVFLVVNPSGATGFGQEWSSRHVNTAGKGVAEDIIGAVKAFTAQHTWVNANKIGCFGASYGGFMTQYLQTQTDIFAAAISHAGISDHTSYWGEGFWGYSYSQTSMGGSYPWTRKDLYVDQSPLFNADKIHTPILFLHGTADTNVPVGESIQMYTALKLLGRPTALVLVEGENHHILAYQKSIDWQHTMEAWFARWLKDEPEWWQSLYPDKKL